MKPKLVSFKFLHFYAEPLGENGVSAANIVYRKNNVVTKFTRGVTPIPFSPQTLTRLTHIKIRRNFYISLRSLYFHPLYSMQK
jgi:hypothetical protein